MSKSLGNFITIRDALARYDAQAIRFYFSLTHYRKQLDFRNSDLERAFRTSHSIRSSVERMKGAMALLQGDETDANLDRMASRFEIKFTKAMDNDFDTEKAVKELVNFAHHLAREFRLKRNNPRSFSMALESLTKLSDILGIW